MGAIPPEIGDLANLYADEYRHEQSHRLDPRRPLAISPTFGYFQIVRYRHFRGEIPPCLADLQNLVAFQLDRNHLEGNIPEGFSDNTRLKALTLAGNKLTGLPQDLLEIDVSHRLWFGSNALPIDDSETNAFLNVLNPDPVPFEGTQTVAPSDFTVVSATFDTVELAWTPIPYQAYAGRYEVFASTGTSFEFAGATVDKTASSIIIDGLEPETTYWFKIRTVTDPVTDPENIHHRNENTVESRWSAEVGGTTEPPPDGDGDGIPDAVDSCPDSEPFSTVVIDGCDSGAPNHLGEDGCTIVDQVFEIAASATNHGDFVSGVAALANFYKKEGLITGREKGKIQSCAARADIP